MTSPSDSRASIDVSAEVKKDLSDLAFQDSHHVKMMFYPEAWAKRLLKKSMV